MSSKDCSYFRPTTAARDAADLGVGQPLAVQGPDVHVLLLIDQLRLLQVGRGGRGPGFRGPRRFGDHGATVLRDQTHRRDGAYLARISPSWCDGLRLIDAPPVPTGQSRETVKRSEFAGQAAYGYRAAHPRHFWGFKLYLLAASDGMPIAFRLVPANEPEREVAAQMFEEVEFEGYTVIGDKGLSGEEIEGLVASLGGAFMRPDRCDKQPRFGSPGAIRQWIEAIFDQLKDQLSLECHGAHTPRVLWVRVLWEAWFALVEDRRDLDVEERRELLSRGSDFFFRYADLLIDFITAIYRAERARLGAGNGQRRFRAIKSLLDDEPSPAPAGLDLEQHHLGLLAWKPPASAAATLGVHEQTVANRLRTAEERLGHPIGSRRLELEVALRLRASFGREDS